MYKEYGCDSINVMICTVIIYMVEGCVHNTFATQHKINNAWHGRSTYGTTHLYAYNTLCKMYVDAILVVQCRTYTMLVTVFLVFIP